MLYYQGMNPDCSPPFLVGSSKVFLPTKVFCLGIWFVTTRFAWNILRGTKKNTTWQRGVTARPPHPTARPAVPKLSFNSNTPSRAPTWTVNSPLLYCFLPTCLTMSLLCFSISGSEPCLPPELLSSFLISSDLWGGREGEAKPGFMLTLSGLLQHVDTRATKTPTADPVQTHLLYLFADWNDLHNI